MIAGAEVGVWWTRVGDELHEHDDGGGYRDGMSFVACRLQQAGDRWERIAFGYVGTSPTCEGSWATYEEASAELDALCASLNEE